ncbi:MAG: hypothetical protein AB1918_09675 [Pseudomonadota bacterium]
MARREIAPGQKYQPTDSNAAWEVREIVKDAEGIPHARLSKVGDPTAIKTISARALTDPRLYRLLPAAAPQPA